MAVNAGALEVILQLKDKLSGQLKTANAGLMRSGKLMQSTGRALLPLSVAMAAVGVGAVVMAAKFEAATSKLVSIANVAEGEIDGVKKAILALGPATGVGPMELVEAMMLISSTTSNTATAMKILETAARASSAGLGTAADFGKALTSVINSYGEENITAARAADILAASIKAGGAEASTIAPQLANVVPIAAQLGISFEEVAANISAVTQLGTPTEQAFTQLASVMTATMKETKEGTEALDAMGMSYSSLRGEIREKGLAAAMQNLLDKLDGNTTGLVEIFGRIEAVKDIMSAWRGGGEAMADTLDKVKNSQGTLADMVEARGKTIADAWNKIKASIEAAAIELGTELLPVAKDLMNNAIIPLVGHITSLVKWFSDLDPVVQKVIIGLGALLIAAGPVLIILGQMAIAAAALGTSLGGVTLALAPVAAAIAVFAGSFLLVTWIRENVEWFDKFADGVAGVLLKIFGFTDALKAMNEEAAKARDPMANLTEEQKKSRAVFDANQEIIGRLTGRLKKEADATKETTKVTKDLVVVTETAAEKATRFSLAAKAAAEALALETQQLQNQLAFWKERDAATDAAIKDAKDFADNMGLLTIEQSKAAKKAQELSDILADKLAKKALAAGGTVKAVTESLMGMGFTAEEAAAKIEALRRELGLTETAGASFADAFKKMMDGLTDTIVGAIMGGGDVFEAAGSFIGGELGKGLGKTLGDMGSELGGTLGSILGPLGALGGKLAGSLIGKGISALGGLFGGGEIEELNDLRDAFFAAEGGFVSFSEKMAAVSDADWAKKIFDAKTVEEFNALILESQGLLDMKSVADEKLQAAVEKYGFTIDELGPKWQAQELEKMAAGLLEEYELLVASGIDQALVLDKMGVNLSEYVNTAIKAGQSVPEAMRPMIEAAIANGEILDENGEAYASAEDAGITFAQTMTESMMSVVDSIKELIAALTGIRVPPIRVPVIPTYPQGVPGRNRGGGRQDEDDYPQLAEGGVVTRPTFALVGEAGPEAIVPLDRASESLGAGDGGPDIDALVRKQTRELAKAFRDAILQAPAMGG